MQFDDLINTITPDAYQKLKRAVELGKWPDGRALSAAQKEICLQAIMLYEAKHNIDLSERIGYVDSKKKTEPCGTDKDKTDDVSTVRILH